MANQKNKNSPKPTILKNISKIKLSNLENKISFLEKKLKNPGLSKNSINKYQSELDKARADFLATKNKYLKAKSSNTNQEKLIGSKQIEQAIFKSNIVKFANLYSSKNKKRRYAFVVLVGILLSITTLFFVQNTGLYTGGLSGLFQGIARISQALILKYNGSATTAMIVYNVLFWGLYFVCNIPLLYLAYKKINRDLCILSSLFITATQITGLILSSTIPNANDINIFGNVQSIQSTMWNANGLLANLMIYSIIQALINGALISILFILGASSGGSDIVSLYYAQVKNKSVALMLFYCNLLLTILGVVLGSFIPYILNSNDNSISSIFGSLLSPFLIFSLLSNILIFAVVNHLFPKHKIIKVNVYSEKVSEIRDYLLETNYSHALTINNTIGGYSWTSKKNIETICMYIELPDIINKIRKVDSQALIATSRILDLDGKIAIAV